MATKFLGQPFEIHTGGVDHIGVHHTNEIAQSEAAEGKPLAKYFVHSEHLLQDGKKMAKSQGHFLRLQDLQEKDYSPLDFRLMCLGAHFQSKLDFTWQSLDSAQSARRKINQFYWGSQGNGEEVADEKYIEKFANYMADNLDTVKALAVLFEVMSEAEKGNIAKDSARAFIQKADEIFKILENKQEIPQEISDLSKERDEYRKSGDYEKADGLRAKIKAMGYVIEDVKGRGKIRRA